MSETLQIDPQMLERYDVTAPRYTSYPTALAFHPGWDEAAYVAHVRAHRAPDEPLSMYVHVPFCHSACFYCACNRIITANRRHAEHYLERLIREIHAQATLLGPRPLAQLHFGGGTPTYLDDDQLERLMRVIGEAFPFAPVAEREFSIEIDPRTVDPARMRRLRGMGFSRVSLGVQDFDPAVQAAINRIQSAEMVSQVLAAARGEGFTSTNMDLIYGLPKQDRARFDATLERIIRMRPERLAIYNYAHLPERFKMQRQIDADTLPGPEEKLGIFNDAIRRLTEAGYVYIGMDHFALPEDELAQALAADTLQRNFQGYSTRGGLDLVGVGSTAIGHIAGAYSQNHHNLAAYNEAIDDGRLAVAKGYRRDADDELRAEVIEAVMCRSRLDFNDVSARHGIDFADYFADALADLRPAEADGLVVIGDDSLTVTRQGRLFLRQIAMPFDAHRRRGESDILRRFSRAI
ncbi:Oxygen-independent coproporphyrinogen III oxidase [wastewater metagenome]|uniref:Oxygen-independent coproporphyrinogen III oxidase n=2 Tax=unclassified sequences TaxID=12908 RepID=A0A5B8R983_9ZZZZ|nr:MULTISPECIES: oxygen-independent coproporphyrinogen III oxidase [Arhodomonas]MCS4503476.1 oxygen-independent coproporphyrinogen III oxidase [Arhodomonas aquaeolei]QEA05709.1 oxygen-independent coproporphyrinogen III oxidase [uncultured organism]